MYFLIFILKITRKNLKIHVFIVNNLSYIIFINLSKIPMKFKNKKLLKPIKLYLSDHNSVSRFLIFYEDNV